MQRMILIALLTCSLNASASGYNDYIEVFLNDFQSGKIDEGIDKVYSSNPYVSAMSSQIDNIKTQLKSLKGLAGEIQYYKKLDEHVVKDSLAQITYLVVYERMPIKFEFQYFKANTGWRIYSFAFDDKVFDLIEPQARESAFSAR